MNLMDRIMMLPEELHEQLGMLVSIMEENEELKRGNEELEEEVRRLVTELEAEKQKIQRIEQLIENSIAQIKELK